MNKMCVRARESLPNEGKNRPDVGERVERGGINAVSGLCAVEGRAEAFQNRPDGMVREAVTPLAHNSPSHATRCASAPAESLIVLPTLAWGYDTRCAWFPGSLARTGRNPLTRVNDNRRSVQYKERTIKTGRATGAMTPTSSCRQAAMVQPSDGDPMNDIPRS
jgi:hypothetical protein